MMIPKYAALQPIKESVGRLTVLSGRLPYSARHGSYLALKYVKSSCFSLFKRSTIDSGNIEGWATGRRAN
jgi:hypothetical protein